MYLHGGIYMEKQFLTIQKIEEVTHNVLRFSFNHPDEVDFTPGQAAELDIDKDGWRHEGHPFTFTSLPDEDYLEFTIKIYPDHEGVTDQLSKLEVGDRIILRDIFGAIHYEGKGTFIAGGAGVTPFISILRDLHRKGELEGNRLLFANSREKDIINKEEFETILGDDFRNILSQEETEEHDYGRIDTEYIKENLTSEDDYVYLCGPPPMMDAVKESLEELGIKDEKIIKEDFA